MEIKKQQLIARLEQYNKIACSILSNKTSKKALTITLRNIGSGNIKKLFSSHLNINSTRNKFELLAMQVKGKVDIFMISETKINESFPKENFLIEEFSTPYRIETDSKGSRNMLYIKKDIPSNLNFFIR